MTVSAVGTAPSLDVAVTGHRAWHPPEYGTLVPSDLPPPVHSEGDYGSRQIQDREIHRNRAEVRRHRGHRLALVRGFVGRHRGGTHPDPASGCGVLRHP